MLELLKNVSFGIQTLKVCFLQIDFWIVLIQGRIIQANFSFNWNNQHLFLFIRTYSSDTLFVFLE